MKKKRYYPGIELLRFFTAAIIAFLYHFRILYYSDPYIELPGMTALYTYGYLGVELFFMVSGFVMYLSYSDRMISLKDFLMKRVIRVYPVMILTVIAAALGQWLSLLKFGHMAILEMGDGRNTLMAFVLSLFGVQCGWIANHDSMSINGPAWFISVVMICYVLFFFTMKYGEEKEKTNICFVLLVLLGIYLS